MGYPMAGFLKKAGHDVVVYNRTPSKAERWADEHGGRVAATPAAAAENAEIVFCCVGNDDDVRDVVLGKAGILNGIAPGALMVDHTTSSATIAREIYAVAAEKTVGFLDAPVSGGQAGAENGQLTVMVGGDPRVFERAAPVMDSYAKAITHIGPSGSGQLAKMVNQICIAGIVQGLSEGLAFCATRRPRPGGRHRIDIEGRGAVLADGESLADDGGGQLRFRIRRRLDAQGSRDSAGRRAPTGRHVSSSPNSSIDSMPRCRPWVAIAGTPPA